MLSYILWTFGFASIFILFLRVFIMTEAEFHKDDPIIKNPFEYAVSTKVTKVRFKEESWRGFKALWAAMQFQIYYDRYRPFVDPKQAQQILVIFAIVLFGVIIVTSIQEFKPENVSYFVGSCGFINTCWIVTIERGKLLKKTIERSRVTI
jgi:hypothetical protein